MNIFAIICLVLGICIGGSLPFGLVAMNREMRFYPEGESVIFRAIILVLVAMAVSGLVYCLLAMSMASFGWI